MPEFSSQTVQRVQDALRALGRGHEVTDLGLSARTADFVRAETGFAIGGVAPIGHAKPIVTLIDEHLLRWDAIWAAAGHPNTVFRLTPDDLVAMTGGRVVAVK